MIYKDCYFCFENQDMGAHWFACNFNNQDFNEKTNPKFWSLGEHDCEFCNHYISKEKLNILITEKMGCAIRQLAKENGKRRNPWVVVEILSSEQKKCRILSRHETEKEAKEELKKYSNCPLASSIKVGKIKEYN